MKNYIIRVISCCLLSCLLLTGGFRSVVHAEVVSLAITGIAVKEVLDEIDQKIADLQSNLKVTTSAIVRDTIMQAEAASNRLRIELANDLDKLVKESSNELQIRLNNLNLSVASLITSASNEFRDLSRDSILDIRSGIAGIALIGGDVGFNYVEKTTVPYFATKKWSIMAHGVKIGFDSSKWKSKAKLTVYHNEKKFAFDEIEVSENSIRFDLPLKNFNPMRNKEEAISLDATLNIEFTQIRSLWFDKKITLEQKIKIIFQPDLAGNINIQEIKPILAWTRRPALNHQRACSTPSGHATSSSDVVHHKTRCDYDHSVPLNEPAKLGNERIYKYAESRCTGGPDNPCGYKNIHGLKVINSGKRAVAEIENWSHGITVTFTAYIERYEYVGDEKPKTNEFSLYRSQPFELIIPKNIVLVRVKGEVEGSEPFTFTLKQDLKTKVWNVPNTANLPLVLESVNETAKTIVYSFKIKKS